MKIQDVPLKNSFENDDFSKTYRKKKKTITCHIHTPICLMKYVSRDSTQGSTFLVITECDFLIT